MAELLMISLIYLSWTSAIGASNSTEREAQCPVLKSGPGWVMPKNKLDIKELVGNWITVYSQPKAISCFTMSIRTTTEMERETCALKYGTFNNRVQWDQCLLELSSPLGKHYLQGVGKGGVFENVIITTTDQGEYYLVEQSADQWTIYGQRGSELLLMRDCFDEAAAVFARATIWPSTTHLYAALHRSGIVPMAEGVLCAPVEDNSAHQQCSSISKFISN